MTSVDVIGLFDEIDGKNFDILDCEFIVDSFMNLDIKSTTCMIALIYCIVLYIIPAFSNPIKTDFKCGLVFHQPIENTLTKGQKPLVIYLFTNKTGKRKDFINNYSTTRLMTPVMIV